MSKAIARAREIMRHENAIERIDDEIVALEGQIDDLAEKAERHRRQLEAIKEGPERGDDA